MGGERMALTVVGIAVVLIGLVFASGGTFGQRCARMYPHGSAMQQEQCVEMLSRGVNPAMQENGHG